METRKILRIEGIRIIASDWELKNGILLPDETGVIIESGRWISLRLKNGSKNSIKIKIDNHEEEISPNEEEEFIVDHENKLFFRIMISEEKGGRWSRYKLLRQFTIVITKEDG